MLKSWKSFIKTGDPSYPGYEWKPYNGIQLHMEIENDATVSIRGNQLYFGPAGNPSRPNHGRTLTETVRIEY